MGVQPVRGLSLWEPWASAIHHRHKLIETRPWDTSYRGEILICSTAKLTTEMAKFANRLWRDTLGIDPPEWTQGMALAVAEVYATDPTEAFLERARRSPGLLTPRERALGDYSSGRFAWRLHKIRRVLEPYPIKGRQRLWRVKPEDEAAIRERLEPLAT